MFFAIDLVGFAGSVVTAVRFHEIPAIGFEFLGFTPRWAAFLGGLVIFVPLIVLTAMVGSRASKAMYKPGLFTLDRVLGATFAALLAVVAVIVGLLFLRAAPIPFGVGDLVKRSTIARNSIDAAAPVVAAVDNAAGLELCGGKLKRVVPEVCGGSGD